MLWGIKGPENLTAENSIFLSKDKPNFENM
jgi:hypothetical protein